MSFRAFGLAVAVCVGVPASGSAQQVFLAGRTTHHGYPYGPRVAPPWSYPGLYGGPFVGYPSFPRYGSPFVNYDPLGPNIGVYSGFGYGGLGYGYGYPGIGYGYGYPGLYRFPGRIGNQWSNGLSAYGPPVPVYGPIPGVFGNNDLVRNYRAAPGIAGYGWIGIYAASPRPRHPNVSVRPTVECVPALPAGAVPATPARSGGTLFLSVKVPQPAAEVLVDGKKTAQTGTDRIFESPPLEAGQAYKYVVTARWIERGQTVEVSREVTGTPGEVVRVDFGTGK
ncbi:MAG TPA: TIGR03000 domain-containing protein [Gemmata sp.]